MDVKGKVFVVTGGGSGIGREVVLTLLRRGARVDALDLRQDGLDETARLAGAQASDLVGHQVDVSDSAALQAAVDKIIAGRGTVDGVLNVAGIIQHFVTVADLSEDEMQKVMAVNFWGPVHLTKALLPHLLSRPEACVVNVSSMGALAPVPGQTIYGASKAAIKLFTEGLYAELRDTPVQVTVVFPGAVATDIASNSDAAVPGRSADCPAAAKITSAVAAAEQIVAGIEKGSYRVVIGNDARMLDRLSRLAPQRATDMIAKKMASLLGS
jgi:NAD(P)-dependent dehydrogenase (short-subunit alcohol dehydrogenase family)